MSAANCPECKFDETNYCTIKQFFTNQRGVVAKEESVGSQSLIICRPSGSRSWYPYRNRVAPLGYCKDGKKK